MKSTIIILSFLLSCNFIYCILDKDNFDYYLDKESFDKKNNIFTFAMCLKFQHDESERYMAKHCMASKIETFEGDIPVKSCPFSIQATEIDTVLGSHLRILPINGNKAMVMSLEKKWIHANALEVFLRLTEIQYEDCKTTRSFSILMSAEEKDILDDHYLNDINILFNNSENVLAIHHKYKFPSQISKLIFDDEGNQRIEPWFEFHHRTLNDIILVKEEADDSIYLLIDNFHSAYLVSAKGSEIKKLDLDHNENSNLIYSTSHDYINLCYKTDSTFNCAVFMDNGELKSERKFDAGWKVNDGFVHYDPHLGLLLITDSYSESCAETELKQFFTTINDDQIRTKEFDCISRDYKMIGIFQRNSKQECFFRIKLDIIEMKLQVETNSLCFMDFIDKMVQEFQKLMDKDNESTENKLNPKSSRDEL